MPSLSVVLLPHQGGTLSLLSTAPSPWEGPLTVDANAEFSE